MVRGTGAKKWKTVQLPEDLLQHVDDIIGNPGLGYTSRSEFIKESVRMRIEETKKKLAEQMTT